MKSMSEGLALFSNRTEIMMDRLALLDVSRFELNATANNGMAYRVRCARVAESEERWPCFQSARNWNTFNA